MQTHPPLASQSQSQSQQQQNLQQQNINLPPPPGFGGTHAPSSSHTHTYPHPQLASIGSINVQPSPYASAAQSIDSQIGTPSPFARAAGAAAAAAAAGLGDRSHIDAATLTRTPRAEETEPFLSNYSASRASGELFTSRSPFAAKAATAFSPQGSLDNITPPLPGSNAIPTQANQGHDVHHYPVGPHPPTETYSKEAQLHAQHAQQPVGPAAYGPPPPGYSYNQRGEGQRIPPTDPNIVAMDSSTWFTGSWVAAADALNGGTALSAGLPRYPWWPNIREMVLIDAGSAYRPMTDDSEWLDSVGNITGGSLSRWKPPYPTATPLSFPTETHPSLVQESLYATLPQDTLFCSFYFHQGSRSQLFAANTLKRQGWRFHKNLKMWFSRTGQPKVATPGYEEGSMAFWDPFLRLVESPRAAGGMGGAPSQTAFSGWGPGTTQDTFRFEYALLENENTNVASG